MKQMILLVILIFFISMTSCSINLASKGGFGDKVKAGNYKLIDMYDLNDKIAGINFAISVNRDNDFIEEGLIINLQKNILNTILLNKGIIVNTENNSIYDLNIEILVSKYQIKEYEDCYRTFVDYDMVVSDYNYKTVDKETKSISGKGDGATSSNMQAIQKTLSNIFENKSINACIQSIGSDSNNLYQHQLNKLSKKIFTNFKNSVITKNSNLKIAFTGVKNDNDNFFSNICMSSIIDASGKEFEILNRTDLKQLIDEKTLSMSGLAEDNIEDSILKIADYLLIGNLSKNNNISILQIQIINSKSGEVIVSDSISFSNK